MKCWTCLQDRPFDGFFDCDKYKTRPQCKLCKSLKTRARRAGITVETLLDLYNEQNGLCAICGSSIALDSNFHVDHDHSCCDYVSLPNCGECNRGILCLGCNIGLGHFQDDRQRLLAAVDYLSRYDGVQ